MAVSDALREEGDNLYGLLKDEPASVFDHKTAFKDWTVWDVIAHLHVSDLQGLASAKGEETFKAEAKPMIAAMKEGRSLIEYTRERCAGISGADLFARWHETFGEMCDRFDALDPDARLKWFGPDMGLRMFATARQMETWAHASEIYDLLGKTRVETDRIQNIVVIGIKTYKFAYAIRGKEAPEPQPYVKLTAPSGAVWEFGEPGENAIVGTAVDFAHTVTQSRNVADTDLTVTGPIAQDWMSIAQCFAGGPEEPPAPGTRGPQKSQS